MYVYVYVGMHVKSVGEWCLSLLCNNCFLFVCRFRSEDDNAAG